MKYHITTIVNDRVVGEFRKPIEDPFVNHTIEVTLLGLLRSLIHGGMTVKVQVGGSYADMCRVMDLD